jgi:hypothetical protein
MLQWCLTACAEDVELAAHVLNSYLAILSLQIYYSAIEEDIPWQSFAQASAEWEYMVEQMYERIPGLDQNTVPENGAVFGEAVESMRDLDGVEALRPLSEESSYRSHLLLGLKLSYLKHFAYKSRLTLMR